MGAGVAEDQSMEILMKTFPSNFVIDQAYIEQYAG